MSEVLDDLATLEELDANLTDIEKAFSKHFKLGTTLSPEVQSQMDSLIKARAGLKAARSAKEAITAILEAFPGDKTAQRSMSSADVMIKRFVKHEANAAKMIRTLSKKASPPRLKKMAATAAKLIKARLNEPKKLQILPWQAEARPYGSGVFTGVEYQMVFRIEDPSLKRGRQYGKSLYEQILAESTVSDTGPYTSGSMGGRDEVMTSRKFADKFLAGLEGWDGMKGEAEATESRQPVAQAMASALNRLVRQLGDPRDTTVSDDFRQLEAEYRSDLPKEGAYGIDENEYNEMEQREYARAKKALESALSPWKKQIKDADIHFGEKGWVYFNITLK